jgi:NAD(P)-dependent dehydrogenase (short-subunit alcohol dehydrogenase family)
VAATAIITGGCGGIGLSTARALQQAGHTVVVVDRLLDQVQEVGDALDVDAYYCDFACLDDVALLADTIVDRYMDIDVLVNNAGGISGERWITEDGHELSFQVNHLAPFLLTTRLLPWLAESKATVIAMSSSINRLASLNLDDLDSGRRYASYGAYAVGKLANIMFTRELHRRYHDQGVSAVSFEPDILPTNFGGQAESAVEMLFHLVSRWLPQNPQHGADTLVWLATSTPGTDWLSGSHYRRRRITITHAAADDWVLCEQLWQRSEEMTRTYR